MTIQLTRGVTLPRIERRTVYRLSARLRNDSMDAAACFESALELLEDWIAQKTAACVEISSHLHADLRPGMDVSFGGYRLRSVLLEEDAAQWAFVLTHPDTVVPTRVWETQVVLIRRRDAVDIRVFVAYAASEAGGANAIAHSRPGFIEPLSRLIGLEQVEPLAAVPWTVDSERELDRLHGLLTSALRTLPIVVLTNPSWRNWKYSGVAPAFLIDEQELARRCFTSCFVVALPFRSTFEWDKRVGKAWSVYDGGIRVYGPGWTADSEDRYLHPLFKKDRIMSWRAPAGETAQTAFARYFCDAVNSGRFSSAGAVRQIAFSDVYRGKLEADRRRSDLTTEERFAIMQQQLDELEAGKQNLEDDCGFYYGNWEEVKDENDRLSEENYNLKSANSALMQALSHGGNRDALDEAVPIPEDYDEMADWCERYFLNTLTLHPRARRELKNTGNLYEDAALVYRCLKLLAVDYRDMKLDALSREEFEQRRSALRVEIRPSATDTTAGLAKEQYYVCDENNKKRRLDQHIRRGNSRDPKHALCVYFYWDEDKRRVVVGWLTSHLDTKGTS